MNIFIDITPLKQNEISGVGYYLKNILKRLLILDDKNKYYLLSFGKKNKGIKISLDKKENVYFVHRNIPSKLVFLTNFFFAWPKLDRLKFNGKIIEPDIVWLPNFNACSLKRKKTRLITTVHDLSFKIHPQFFNFKRKVWHYLVNPKKIFKRSNKLITVSNNTSLDLQNIYNVPKDNIIIMSLGVSKRYRIIELKDKLIAVKSKYNLPDNFILFVGTREPRKNILSLLSAFSKLKHDINLVIAGGHGWKENLWKNFYDTLDNNIKTKIKLLDYFPEKDLPVLYNLAKVFVWPSFYEGFGLPPLEALACACPVITSNNSSLPEVVKDNALLIEAFNVENLYQAINSLLKNEELYNFYKSKKFNEEYYRNWDKSAEKLLSLFKKI